MTRPVVLVVSCRLPLIGSAVVTTLLLVGKIVKFSSRSTTKVAKDVVLLDFVLRDTGEGTKFGVRKSSL